MAQIVQLFLTDTADVRLVPIGRNSSVTCEVVIPFVKTQVLGLLFRLDVSFLLPARHSGPRIQYGAGFDPESRNLRNQ